jgi:uncharacterized damage-inducible protein DinB
MSFAAEIDYLLEYTEWDRKVWAAYFHAQGPDVFAVDLGANSDGRIKNIGELVRHIFAAEQRYVERIKGVPLTDGADVPPGDVEALFEYGRQSRQNLRYLLLKLPEAALNRPQEIQLGQTKRMVTPKTMIVQAVTHEIRHWAQIATLLRINGRKTGPHDFLVSGIFERSLAAYPAPSAPAAVPPA